jgi:hypothetical protein
MSIHDRAGSRPPNRDADLERAWRDASDEQPPSHVDAAIIAAARKSIPDRGAQPVTAPARVQSRNWLLHWQPLAAAATVAGLAFVLVQMLPREHDLAPAMQHKESAPTAVTPQAGSSSAREATDNSSLPSVDTTVAQPERVVVPEATRAQGVVPAPPAGEAGADRGQAIEAEMPGRTVSAAAAAPAPSAREKNLGNAAPLDAATWIARILALHAAGDVTAAADALRAFRAADPGADAYLPESLREWARTVE